MELNTLANVLYRKLADGQVISLADRQRVGLDGASIESLLDAVVRQHRILLHGAGTLIRAGAVLRLSRGRPRFGRPPRSEEGFATDSAGIALLKALFHNIVNLSYPYVITSKSPLALSIDNWRPEAERTLGYVHLIGPRTHFERERDIAEYA